MHSLILGFDSFDPILFESLHAQGKLPHLGAMAEASKYARFTVSDPPQTEVSWTSIATGANPGVHGIFDFVHRDPATYTPYVSLLPTQRGKLGVQFVSPHQANTIFDEAAKMGYPSTSLWWPATFPARPGSPVRTIPGLGAPDLLGRLGVGVLFSDNPDLHDPHWKTPLQVLHAAGKGRFTSFLQGPELKPGQFAQLDFSLESSAHKHRLVIGKQSLELQIGQWSPLFEVEFKLGFFFKVKAVTRALLTQTEPDLRLYMLPLQMHPLAAAWRYATPPGFVKGIWKDCGPYLTLGWPQDTTGLEEGHLNDAQFLALCETIFAGRECVLMQQMQSFNEGVLGILFDDLDRIQHMFRRDHPEVLEVWYQKLDALVGRVQQRLAAINPKARLLVLSDHGFSEFTYKFHLNHWLLDNGYLVQKASSASQTDGGLQASGLQDVDWSRSQAYAVGLNSLYLNLRGREGQGSLAPEAIEPLLEKLRGELLALKGPD